MFKVSHVISNLSQKSQGPAYTVPNLCSYLATSSNEIEIHTLKPLPDSKVTGVNYMDYSSLNIFNRLGISPEMYSGLVKSKPDIIHNHLLWMMPNVYAGLIAKNYSNIHLITSPRGTLSLEALNISKYKKKLFWQIAQKHAIDSADCIHATSFSEYSSVRALSRNQPIAVIPNGVHIPIIKTYKSTDGNKRLIYLGRIHKIKGIENLINAWAHIEREFDDWSLYIYGEGEENYVNRLKKLAMHTNTKRVEFMGPIYGQQKDQVYQEANLFVLPSYSENFAMVVAEALANHTPVITTRETPWEDLLKHECGWWIDTGVKPLVSCLKEALSSSDKKLQEMGLSGRNLVEREYSWEEVSSKMLKTYEWILTKGNRPSWVYTD